MITAMLFGSFTEVGGGHEDTHRKPFHTCFSEVKGLESENFMV